MDIMKFRVVIDLGRGMLMGRGYWRDAIEIVVGNTWFKKRNE